MRLADRSMSTKIFLSSLPALLSLIVIAFLLWTSLVAIGTMANSADESDELIQELLKREIDHLKWASTVSTYIISGSGALDVQTDDAKCGFGQWYFGDKRKRAEARIPGISIPLAKLAEPHRQLHQAAVSIAAHKKAGDAAKATEVFVSVVAPRLQEIQTLLDEVRKIVDVAANADVAALNNEIERSRRLLAIASILAVALSLGGGFLIARTITRPVRELTDYASCVAGGQIHCTLDLMQKDEIGQLADSLRTMVLSLRNQLDYSKGVLGGFTVPCSLFSKEDTTVFTNQLMVDLIERGGKPEDYHGLKSGHYIFNDPSRDTLSSIALRENRAISAEREIKTLKGNTRHVAISSAPFHNSQGEILGTLSVWVDQTALMEQQHRIETNNQAIMEVAQELGQVVDVVGSASQELAAQVEQSSQGAKAQAERIGEAAAAMEEMNATVVEVSRNAAQASTSADQAKHKAEDGEQIVSKVIAEIQEVQTQAQGLKNDMTSLGRQAEGIGQILNVISDIADQTNLLALNAAIEAARAGDAGRGFAVVADEVRKLAEKTMTATKEVGEAISGIQQGTRKNIENVEHAVRRIGAATGLAEDSGQALHAIVSLVDQTTDQVRSIATAAEQQSATSEEINRTLADINTVSGETAQAMQEASSSVNDLAAQANALQRLMARMNPGD